MNEVYSKKINLKATTSHDCMSQVAYLNVEGRANHD